MPSSSVWLKHKAKSYGCRVGDILGLFDNSFFQGSLNSAENCAAINFENAKCLLTMKGLKGKQKLMVVRIPDIISSKMKTTVAVKNLGEPLVSPLILSIRIWVY